jgi:hypothetical protein
MQRSLSIIIFLVHTNPLIEEKAAHLSKGDRVKEKDDDGGTPLHFCNF